MDLYGIVCIMLKNKSIHIPITDEKLKILRNIAKRDRRKITALIDLAIEQYLKSRKIKEVV